MVKKKSAQSTDCEPFHDFKLGPLRAAPRRNAYSGNACNQKVDDGVWVKFGQQVSGKLRLANACHENLAQRMVGGGIDVVDLGLSAAELADGVDSQGSA